MVKKYIILISFTLILLQCSSDPNAWFKEEKKRCYIPFIKVEEITGHYIVPKHEAIFEHEKDTLISILAKRHIPWAKDNKGNILIPCDRAMLEQYITITWELESKCSN